MQLLLVLGHPLRTHRVHVLVLDTLPAVHKESMSHGSAATNENETAPFPSFIATETGHQYKESAAAGGLNLARLTNRRLRFGDSLASLRASTGQRIVGNQQGGASPLLPTVDPMVRNLTSHACHVPHLRRETTHVIRASYPQGNAGPSVPNGQRYLAWKRHGTNALQLFVVTRSVPWQFGHCCCLHEPTQQFPPPGW